MTYPFDQACRVKGGVPAGDRQVLEKESGLRQVGLVAFSTVHIFGDAEEDEKSRGTPLIL